MVATKSPTVASKPSSSSVNPSDIVQKAIQDKDVTKARDLLKERTKSQFMFRDWARLIDTGVNSLNEHLRNEFRAILMEIAKDKISTFLRTALQSSEEEEVAILILQHHPKLFEKKLDGDSPFHLAASNGEARVVSMFLQFVKDHGRRDMVIPLANEKGNTIGSEQRATQPVTGLERAAEKGHLEVVEMLVDFDKRLLEHGYPLHRAVREGRPNVVKYLLEKKSDLVEKFTPGPSPKSALFEERTLGKEDESSIAIDKMLVASIIRGPPGVNRTRSPAMIKKLLQGPQGRRCHHSYPTKVLTDEYRSTLVTAMIRSCIHSSDMSQIPRFVSTFQFSAKRLTTSSFSLMGF